ncbi:hypothetical protein LPB72_16915 [Hydrogenophaga crassostreae]|uniref:DUF4124 domain-containing protein n=1 Tax=Hydrogenophaga crassostreae TaxID=1763535 RepID=A0A167HA04_9BURK|nr:hypothetical protein [Hydrogenophaga crassostreae]AOW12699.1 hypothetical protein LPB072_07435 [Hydrogenophaga crassostreae]OAD40571.1 hypothetical protein LPB72_16915 [Hydrogenophaga crassostreae]
MKPVFALAGCLIALPALAQIVRCDLPDGRVAYQASPCDTGKASPVRHADAPASDDGPAFPPLAGGKDPLIVGDAQFQARVREALALLKTRDARTYVVVTGYVGKIEQAAHSGMDATAEIPTFNMSDATAMYSVTWAAASIAHDAYHSKLYHDHKGAHPNSRVPDNIWTGNIAESKCIQFQIASMRRFNAPQNEIDNTAAQFQGYYANQPLSKRKH